MRPTIRLMLSICIALVLAVPGQPLQSRNIEKRRAKMNTEAIQEFHEKCVYPAVRVRAQDVGGSGTVIYSKMNDKGEFDTFILTNWHVVERLIKTKDDWDSLLKKTVKREFTEPAIVELFDYVKISTMNSANAHQADIVAYDKAHDLAILKLASPKQVKNVATLIPKESISDIYLTTDVVIVGSSLLHDPVISFGKVTSLKEIIDNKLYIMSSADSYFGNSGGSLYLVNTKELIGVPSRVSAMQLGFGVDIITWMGFACHPKRLYEFIDEQELKFLYDPSDKYEDALKRREKRQKEALWEIMKGGLAGEK